MRSKWAALFDELGGTLGADDLKEFKALFGGKFKNYLGSTYDIFQDKSILPWLRYKPAAEAVENAKNYLKIVGLLKAGLKNYIRSDLRS